MKKYYSILLVLILPYISQAQIKIEERVEIDPQIIQPNYPAPQYTPCGPYPEQTDFYNPYQVIWNRGWLYIDPYQQLFNHQGNDYTYSLSPLYTYNVEITQGGEYCWIQKAGYTDPNTGEVIEPEVVGDQLLGISGEELIGTGQWRVLPGCFIDEKEYPSQYSIYFERDIPAGTEVIVKITGGSTVINYHTIVETPLLTIENGTGLDTLYHYYGRWIDVLAEVNESYYENRPYCWRCGGELPSSVTFTLELIEGQEYGVLYDVETDETALSFSGIVTESGSGSIFTYGYGYRFKFIADGAQPDSTQPGTVTIRCTPSDGDINTVEFSFPVAYNEYPPEQGILVQFAQPQLAPGDTTQILLKKRNPDGTLEDFSQWDGFEIGMIEGCEAGEILIGGSLGVYFEEAYQPIYFVASSNLTETDTVVVRVGLIEGIETRPVNIGGEEKEFVVEGMKKKIEEPNSPGDNPPVSCIPYLIERDYAGNGGVVVGDECDEDRPAGLTAIDENMYTINQLPNNTNCNVNNEEARLVGGRLMTTIHPPKLSDWGLSPRKSVVELRFTFDWSYCIDLLMQSFTKAQFIELEQVDNKYKVYNPIEGTFREINGPGEARKIISAIKEIGSDGRTIPENIEYYPLPRTKKHEFEHIVQYWDEISYNFIIALYHINKRQPPRNWCKLSEEEKHRIYNSEDEWYRITLDNAVNETLDYMNDKEQEKLNEASAHAVSYYYLHSVVIPRIKEQFKLP